MKYDVSLEEILDSGFVVKVSGVPSWFDKLFSKSINEKYIVCRDGSNFICAQKVGTKIVTKLIEKNENGVWCREIRRGEEGPEYRAPLVLAEVYWFCSTQYSKQFIEQIYNDILEEVKDEEK